MTPASPIPDAGPGRPYAGRGDLRSMEACLSASWSMARPFVSTTPGDLEWWIASGAPDTDWSRRIRLWGDGEAVDAYAWFNAPGELDWHQRAGLPVARRAALVDAAIAWAATMAIAEAEAAGTGTPEHLTTWALDTDEALAGLLAGRGWTPRPDPGFTHWYRHLGGGTIPADGPPPHSEVASPVPLPPGYRLRHVRLPQDRAARVEVHRAAFAPSRMTEDKYRVLAGMDRYVEDRDLVVEAPDGSLAAFAIVWWVPEAGIGEFEPVGTHPDHRRLGLGRVVMEAGVRRLAELGAAGALVLSHTANAASERLYASAGFEALTHHRAWTRPL